MSIPMRLLMKSTGSKSSSVFVIGYRLRGWQCVTALSGSQFHPPSLFLSASFMRDAQAEKMSGSACTDCLSSAQHLNSSHPHIDEDEELLKYIWREYLHPKQYEWVLIAGYIIVFLVSLVGNTLGKFAWAS